MYLEHLYGLIHVYMYAHMYRCVHVHIWKNVKKQWKMELKDQFILVQKFEICAYFFTMHIFMTPWIDAFHFFVLENTYV